jgi:hypothetical protein
MKRIPESLLRKVEAEAKPPVKKVGTYTAEIFAAVADIKAAEKLGKDMSPAWMRLREIIDEAASHGDATAFEDMQKALKNLNVAASHFTIRSGEQQWEITSGRMLNPPIRPVTVALVKAIRDFQFDRNRAPDRQEILTAMNKILENGIDETELSRQLTRLGWNELI